MPSPLLLTCIENIDLITINKAANAYTLGRKEKKMTFFFFYSCAIDEHLVAVGPDALTSDEASCTLRTSVNEIFVL